MNIGNSIKQLRTEANLTVTEFAKAVGISPQYLRKLESGKKREPTEATMQKIAKALNIPVAIIYVVAIDNSDIPENNQAHSLYSTVLVFGKDLILKALKP